MARTFWTRSYSPEYWPREPTEIPLWSERGQSFWLTICMLSDSLGAIAGEVGHQYVGSVCPTNSPSSETHRELHLG